MGEDKDKFYSLRFSIGSYWDPYFLNQYNKTSLSKIKTVKIGHYGLFSFFIQNKFYTFYQSYNSNNWSAQLLMDVYSMDSGERFEHGAVMAEISAYARQLNEQRFDVILTADSAKLLVISRNSSEEDKPITLADLYSIKNYTKFWSKKLMSEHNGHIVKTRSYQIDTAGNLYYLFVYEGDSIKHKPKEDGIAVILNKDTAATMIPLKIPNNTNFYNPNLQYFLEDTAIFFTCNFKDANHVVNANAGIMYAKISTKDQSMIFCKVEYFSKKNKLAMECNSAKESITKHVFMPIKIKKINGEYYLYTYSDSKPMINFVTYHFSEVVVVYKLNSSGKTEWQSFVPRSTHYRYTLDNNDPTNISVFEKNNKLNFLFVDDPSNKEGIPDVNNFTYCKIKSTGTVSNTNLVLMSVDKSGTITRKILCVNDKDWILPENITIQHQNQFILRYNSKGHEGFGRLTINPD